jgi:hypothetical protein
VRSCSTPTRSSTGCVAWATLESSPTTEAITASRSRDGPGRVILGHGEGSGGKPRPDKRVGVEARSTLEQAEELRRVLEDLGERLG